MTADWTLASVFHQAVAGFAVLDLDGQWLEVNAAAERLLGRRREALIGRPAWEGCDAAAIDAVRERLARVRDGAHRSFQLDIPCPARDGGVAWRRLRASAVNGPDGRIAAFAGGVEDVSDEHHDRMPFFDLCADLLAVATLDGYIERVNPAWEAALGWSTAEMRSRPYIDFVHPDDRERTQAMAAALAAGEPQPPQFRNRQRTRDGRYRWLEWRVQADRATGRLFCSARDVTERQQAMLIFEAELERRRAALQQAEQRLVAHVSNTPLAVVEFDADFRVSRWSSRAEAMFGWSAQEVIGRRLGEWRFVHDDDADDVAVTAQCLVTGDAPSVAIRNRNYTRDGGVVHCEWFNSAVYDRDGRLESILALAQDVSARVAAEREAEERAAMFAATFEQAPVGIAHVALDGRWMRVNRTLADFLGYDDDALLATTFQAITHPDDLAADLDQVAALLDGRITRYEMRKRYLHREGHEVWAQLTVSLRHDAAGAPLHFIAVVEDIAATIAIETALATARDELEARVIERTRELETTNRTLAVEVEQRREAEAALRESELRMRSILENSHDAFVACEEDGRIAEWNRSAEAIFGWRRSEVLGKPLSEVIVPAAMRAAHDQGMARYMASGEARVLDQRLQLPARHRNGHEFPVELTISRVRLGRRSLFTAFLHDISERMAADDALRKAERRLRTITDNAPAIITYMDLAHRFQFVNATFCDWYGLTPPAVLGRSIAEVRGDAVYAVMKPLLERARRGEHVETDLLLQHVALGPRECHVTLIPDANDAGDVQGFHVMAYDITEHKALAQVLAHRATHDELTGLPNRAGFAEALDARLAQHVGTAVLFLDLDGFKQVNDQFGHEAGDAVLREFAARLRACVDAEATVARLAGDEFVVALRAGVEGAAARNAANAIERALEPAFIVGAQRAQLSSSIGIAIQEPGEVDREALVRRADAAMYVAKRGADDRAAVTEDAM